MPDQGTIFRGDSSQQQPATTTTTQGDPLPESVALLVGEGRKYKTIEELAKAYVNIDGFAETLKSENAALKEDAKKAATLDEVLKRLEVKADNSTQDQRAQTTQSGLSVADVATIVQQQITGRETQRTQEANLLKADTEMRKLFGDKAEEVFRKEAATPDMKKALMALAAVAPDKFVALFQPATTGGTTTDNSSVVNTAALTGGNVSGRVADPGCKEFYDNLRRTKPAHYYSSAVQSTMNKVAVDNPRHFFNRDL